MKVAILDSGPLINLSMNGLIYVLKNLKELTGVRFAITKDVKYETLDKPIGIPRFELGALTISELIKDGIIEMPEKFKVSDSDIKKRTSEIMSVANQCVIANGKFVSIVSSAEMSCLALSDLLREKGVENIIGVDERTTRVMGEDIDSLVRSMSERMHTKIKIDKSKVKYFSKYRFIRSTEIVYVAFKLGVLNIHDPKALEAGLYATKFKGASVSFDEIEILKKLAVSSSF